MTRPIWTTIISATILLTLTTASAGGPPDSPDAVVAISLGIPVLITWTPTPDAEYRVYGVDALGELQFLGTVASPWMIVETTYSSYAVTAVGAGGESAPTYASTTPCVEMQPSFPFVRVVECAVPGIPAKLMRT